MNGNSINKQEAFTLSCCSLLNLQIVPFTGTAEPDARGIRSSSAEDEGMHETPHAVRANSQLIQGKAKRLDLIFYGLCIMIYRIFSNLIHTFVTVFEG
jgi:hypothetical protein